MVSWAWTQVAKRQAAKSAGVKSKPRAVKKTAAPVKRARAKREPAVKKEAKKPAVADPPKPVLLNQVEAARALGITDRQLRNWRNEADFPDCSAGYDVAVISAWRDKHCLSGSAGQLDMAEVKLAREREQLEIDRIKRAREALKLEAEEKELLPRRSWELFAATLLTNLGDWCEQLPDILAGVCTDDCREGVRERLARELDDRRRDLREELSRKFAELEGSNGD